MNDIQLNTHYSYKSLQELALNLSKQYSGILSYETIGKSCDQRDIFLLKLGCGPTVYFFTGGVHGRETINPIVLLKIIEILCQDRMVSLNIQDIVHNYSLCFVPLLNPDGYTIATALPYASEWKGNARGVDLNRNFHSKSYRQKHLVDHPFSEPESCALRNAFAVYHPSLYMDFHSRGKTIYYYRNALDEKYNSKQLKIAKDIHRVNGYSINPPDIEIDENDTGGNTVHYFSELYNKPAITIETAPDEADFPMSPHYQIETLKEVVPIFQYLLKSII